MVWGGRGGLYSHFFAHTLVRRWPSPAAVVVRGREVTAPPSLLRARADEGKMTGWRIQEGVSTVPPFNQTTKKYTLPTFMHEHRHTHTHTAACAQHILKAQMEAWNDTIRRLM